MYKKEDLNRVYDKLADSIDISEELFDKAEQAYQDLGHWIDKETPDYKISIYPQGSFALGTVIKPINDTDDYDLDLVCQFNKNYGFSARTLKVDVVKPLLVKYDKVTKIEEKRRCWQVLYEKTPNFHMDIIPSINVQTYIMITNKNEEENTYEYIGSNPKGYIAWFNERKKVRYNKMIEQRKAQMKFRAEVETLKEYHLKTPLQKAIQILKRHRDIMFKDDKNHLSPISIIITTIAAQLYNNEDNIYDTLNAILSNAKSYVVNHMVDSKFHIDNPSYTGEKVENFADKWNEHPERAGAFLMWVEQAYKDFLSDELLAKNRVEFAESLKKSIGEGAVNKTFSALAESERSQIKEQILKVSAATGAISSAGTIPIATNHHHGKENI